MQSLTLSPLEHDALTELLNMGVGRAATSLSRMISDQVTLSVPRVEITSPERAVETLGDNGPNLVAVSQNFVGRFAGRALLIFPEGNSLELVRAVLGNGYSLEDIIELEQEALAEIGNVLLNGCLVIMANSLQETLKMSLPSVIRGTGQTVLDVREDQDRSESLVLFLYVDFRVRSRNVRGYIVLLMDLPSLEVLRDVIRNFLKSIQDREMPDG